MLFYTRNPINYLQRAYLLCKAENQQLNKTSSARNTTTKKWPSWARQQRETNTRWIATICKATSQQLAQNQRVTGVKELKIDCKQQKGNKCHNCNNKNTSTLYTRQTHFVVLIITHRTGREKKQLEEWKTTWGMKEIWGYCFFYHFVWVLIKAHKCTTYFVWALDVSGVSKHLH